MTAEQRRYWQDIQPGEAYDTGSLTITRRDILDFAAEFDPQPYHLDSEAADTSIFGGLCASGWHVTALMMRLLTDRFASAGIDLLGSNGVSHLRWRKPVFAGDILTSTIEVTGKSGSDSDSRFGFVECTVNVVNQDRESVIHLVTSLIIGSRAQPQADSG